MKMDEWAENEVKIACKKENPNWNENKKEFDYGCSCYQSALKAYKSLCEDGHSGASFVLTKKILIRLMDGNPLTPITDEDFFKYEVNKIGFDSKYLKSIGLKSEIQCPRKSSLFRMEDLQGNVSYSDNDRAVFVDGNGHYWGNGLVKEIIDKMFPIKMPYYPKNGEKYKVYGEDFLQDKKNGDYDHKALLYVITPEGERIELDEFYKEIDGKMVKITKEEYYKDKEESL